MSTPPSSSPPKPIPNVWNFVFGGAAGMMAVMAVHPLNILKNRMQLTSYRGEKVTQRSVIRDVIKADGLIGLYKGLTASLLRQATYTTARLGVYSWLFEVFKSSDGTPPSLAGKAALGIISGACGAVVGTPAELCLIRMTTDGHLPEADRRHYTHVGNALVRIIKEEGILTLWRGCVSTVVRACVVNATQLASYSQIKQLVIATGQYEDGFMVYLIASMMSGFATSCTSLPVDILKTRIQNMKYVNGVPEYKGAMDAFGKIIKHEGVLTLWKGFLPYYIRIGPHTILTFLFLEQMHHSYRKYFM